MLSGEVLSLSVATYYDGSEPPTNPHLQILYPAVPGTYTFFNISSKNITAKLKVINSQNFEIEYSFFATIDFSGWGECVNSIALKEVGSFDADIGFSLKIKNAVLTHTVPIYINNDCGAISFENTEFIPGVETIIDVVVDGSVDNNFYVGIIRKDAVSNAQNIRDGLFKSYARIGGNGATNVDDILNSYFNISSKGFYQKEGKSYGKISIDANKLLSNAEYEIVLIYFKDGSWNSCLLHIRQKATHKPVEAYGTFIVTDGYGNVAESSCVSGVSQYSLLNLSYQVDIPTFDAALITGTYTDYYKSVKAFISDSPSALGGQDIQVGDFGFGLFKATNLATTFLNGNTKTYSKVYIIFQLEFEFDDHKDFVNVPFELTYDAEVEPINIEVKDTNSNVVEDLCEGENYTTNYVPDGTIFVSYDQVTFAEISSININEIPYQIEPCYSVLSSELVDQDDCDCPACNDLSVQFIIQSSLFDNNFEAQIVSAPEYTVQIQGSPNNFLSFPSHGFYQPFIFPKVTITHINGCVYEATPTIYHNGTFTIYSSFLFSTLKKQDCDCVETDLEYNTVSMNFNVDEDNEVISLGFDRSFNSTIDTETILCSTDGGVTFIPCPSTIMGESNVLVTYKVTFTDNHPPISMEQNISYPKSKFCENTRELDLVIDSNTLVIDFITSFESDVLQDVLSVSIDGGLSFISFNPSSSYTPIPIENGDKIVVENRVVFDDGCNDIVIIKTKVIDEEVTPCNYDNYSLAVQYEEASSSFIIEKNGSELGLEINELLWTIDNGNPFDDNNSGVPYLAPIMGYGLLIAGWKIKLVGCDEKIIYAVHYESKKLEIHNIPTIQVTLPKQPIQMCIVECCEGFTPTIECVNRVLTVTNAPAGSQINWSGPNGFNGSGNNLTIPQVSGIYYVSIVDTTANPPCTSTGQYSHTEPNAGTPSSNPIIVS
jgi:hypothetical protein